MVRHKIAIDHVYQDVHNPHIQEVILEADYALAYAFFSALIDQGHDFSVELVRSEE